MDIPEHSYQWVGANLDHGLCAIVVLVMLLVLIIAAFNFSIVLLSEYQYRYVFFVFACRWVSFGFGADSEEPGS